MKLSLFRYYWSWLITVLLFPLTLKKRDKHIWLFGSWSGNQYSDNTKYQFEYVVENLPEIRAVWVTDREDIKKELLQKGHECYLSSERKGKQMRLKAGFVFFSVSMFDIGRYDLCLGACKVALWHGMPIKKMGFATNKWQKRHRNPILLLKYWKMKIYNDRQRDISIATSPKTKEILMQSFELKPDTVYITGQPRNDGLFKEGIINKAKESLSHDPKEKFILYMPTWRQSYKKGDFFIAHILDQLLNDDAFLKKLKAQNIKLYINLHPNIKKPFPGKGNVIVINKDKTIDTQSLMACADVLISDYSSAFIDYALLNRPIQFFIPDVSTYIQRNNGLFFKFEDFTQFRFGDIEHFKEAVFNDLEIKLKGLKNTALINDIFNDPSLEKATYSKAVADLIINKMKTAT